MPGPAWGFAAQPAAAVGPPGHSSLGAGRGNLGIAAPLPMREFGSTCNSPAACVAKLTVRLRYPDVWLDVIFCDTESCQRSRALRAEALW
jgi:hypothetical protein